MDPDYEPDEPDVELDMCGAVACHVLASRNLEEEVAFARGHAAIRPGHLDGRGQFQEHNRVGPIVGQLEVHHDLVVVYPDGLCDQPSLGIGLRAAALPLDQLLVYSPQIPLFLRPPS